MFSTFLHSILLYFSLLYCTLIYSPFPQICDATPAHGFFLAYRFVICIFAFSYRFVICIFAFSDRFVTQHLYTGALEHVPPELSLEVLLLADRYEIAALRNHCALLCLRYWSKNRKRKGKKKEKLFSFSVSGTGLK